MAGERSRLTEEQLKRMEQNRKRALEIRINAQNKRIATTPVSNARNNTHDNEAAFVTPPTNRRVSKAINPYANAKQLTQQHSLQSQCRPVTSPFLAQQTKSSRNAMNQHPLLERNAAPCEHCGKKTVSNELCIRWWHTSQLNRSGRYACCGRLKGQPCHVGRHSPSSNCGDIPSSALMGLHSQAKVQIVQCKCRDNLQARIRRTRKECSQQGRLFFQCSAEKRPRCNYFQYVDELFNVRQASARISSGGIQEWECPFAFPLLDKDYEQQSASSQLLAGDSSENGSLESKRERIILAFMVAEMFKNVVGQHGWACSSIPKETLVNRVVKDFNDANFFPKLRPLSYRQVVQIFGLPDNQNMTLLTKEECFKSLERLMRRSSLMISTVFAVRNEAGVTSYDLSGLDSFLNV